MEKRPLDSFTVDSDGRIVIEMNMDPPEDWRETFNSLDDCIEWIDDQIATLTAPGAIPSGHMTTKEEMAERAKRYEDLKQRILTKLRPKSSFTG